MTLRRSTTTKASMVPAIRIRAANEAPVRADGHFVLYWMTAARRTTWNFGLQRAVECAREQAKPLLVLEALRCDYPWASDRLHRFVLDGMADNAAELQRHGMRYYPYVEPRRGAGRGLLAALAARASLVVADDFPCFFLPRMISSAARQLDVRLEVVDSNGLLPLAAAPQAFTTAHAFRRFLQKNLRAHLVEPPRPDPLLRAQLRGEVRLPRDITTRWPQAAPSLLAGKQAATLASLPIDHEVPPVNGVAGGSAAARAALERFLRVLPRYADEHSAPEADVTSHLSPYLHFGHIGVHEVFHAVMLAERWSPHDLAPMTSGARQGWWGVRPAVEAFLDQLVTWRELGYVFCERRPDYEAFTSLPEWAQRTLGAHAADPREHVYTLRQFEAAATHDPLWNAAQTQLREEGRIHNYLRMLWGKKILEWTRDPRTALRIMIELNNKWALDGRNPNSYSGIFWVLGRFDRPWGPERDIFGTVRYMSSDNTARKFRTGDYVRRFTTPGRRG